MVEEKGLDIVGIYRVPGNSAAVNALTEQVSVLASWKSINFCFVHLSGHFILKFIYSEKATKFCEIFT